MLKLVSTYPGWWRDWRCRPSRMSPRGYASVHHNKTTKVRNNENTKLRKNESPVNTKHLYNICTMLALGWRCTNVMQMFCVCWEYKTTNVWNNESTKQQKYETTKVRNKESTKLQSTKLRKYETAKVRNNKNIKQRKCERKKLRNNERARLRNNERAMRNCERALRNNESGKYETRKQRKGDAKLRKGDENEGDFKQRKCEMALSGHHVKELTNWKKTFGFHGLYRNISALLGLDINKENNTGLTRYMSDTGHHWVLSSMEWGGTYYHICLDEYLSSMTV